MLCAYYHKSMRLSIVVKYTLNKRLLFIYILVQGIIHLVDKQGVAIPPSLSPDQDNLNNQSKTLGSAPPKEPQLEAIVLNRGNIQQQNDANKDSNQDITDGVSVPGGDTVILQERSTGKEVARYSCMSKVWVQLRADAHRAHGPALKVRLLDERHPAVQAAAQQAQKEKNGGHVKFNARDELLKQQQGGGENRQSNELLGMAAGQGGSSTGGNGKKKSHTPESLAAALSTALQELSLEEEKDSLATSEPSVNLASSASGSAAWHVEGLMPSARLLNPSNPTVHQVQEAYKKLLEKACRYALRALEVDPDCDKAAMRLDRAAECWQEAERLQAWLKAVQGEV